MVINMVVVEEVTVELTVEVEQKEHVDLVRLGMKIH